MEAIAYQVKFKPKGEDDEYNGILIYNETNPEKSMIVCACCGGVASMDEIESYEKYPTWVDFSEEI